MPERGRDARAGEREGMKGATVHPGKLYFNNLGKRRSSMLQLVPLQLQGGAQGVIPQCVEVYVLQCPGSTT